MVQLSHVKFKLLRCKKVKFTFKKLLFFFTCHMIYAGYNKVMHWMKSFIVCYLFNWRSRKWCTHYDPLEAWKDPQYFNWQLFKNLSMYKTRSTCSWRKNIIPWMIFIKDLITRSNSDEGLIIPSLQPNTGVTKVSEPCFYIIICLFYF